PAWQEPVVDAEALATDNGEHWCIAELAVVSGFYPFPLGSELLEDARVDITGDVTFIPRFGGDGRLRYDPGSDPLEPGYVLFVIFLKMHGNGPLLGKLTKAKRFLEQFLFLCQPGKIGITCPAER